MAAALPTRPSGAKFEEFTPEDAKEESRLTNQILLAKVSFKPKGSYDSEFFHKVAQTTKDELERTRLNKKQSGYNFFKSRGECDEDAAWNDWIQSEKAKKLDERESNLDLAARLYQDQAVARESDKDQARTNRRTFIQLWTTCKEGFKANREEAAIGSRSGEEQQALRTALEDACNSRHPDWPRRRMLWCPVLGGWIAQTDARAAHIFPHRLGQTTMTSIFGNDTEVPEMMESRMACYCPETLSATSIITT